MMAIERIGSLVEYQCGAATPGTVTPDITVPSDADILILCVHGWVDTTYTFTEDTSGIAVEGTACPIEETVGNASASDYQGALFVADVSALRGATDVTLTWAWKSGLTEPVRLVYGFYKGVDLSSFPSSAYRDLDGAQDADVSDGVATPSLTAASGDLIVAWAWGYHEGGSSAPTWTSPMATVTNYLTTYGTAVGSWAEGSPTGNMAPAITAWSGNTDGGMSAIVLKPAADADSNFFFYPYF
jgi:hypothetical protein